MAFSTGGGSNGIRGLRSGRRFGASTGTLSEINIVPLVDVVLVLLIIFMLTAHVMEYGMDIQVPEVKQTHSTVEDLPVLTITRDGHLALNGKGINIHEIPDELKRRFKGQNSVYVWGDRNSRYDQVVQVISELSDAHIEVKLVAKPADFGQPK